jgi:hypothetical protein
MEKAGIKYEEEGKANEIINPEINTVRKRPKAQKIDPSKSNIVFMQLDLDYSTNQPPGYMDMGEEVTTVVRMFGVTQQQHSVMVHIYNFRPYFYAKLLCKLTSFNPCFNVLILIYPAFLNNSICS